MSPHSTTTSESRSSTPVGFLPPPPNTAGALTADAGYAKAKQNLARVEAVKVVQEEPFDLEAIAK